MARAIWSGQVSFGLVSIPVKLFNATSPKDVRFHQFDRESGRRVRYRRVTESVGDWGPPDRLAREPDDAIEPGGAPAVPEWDEPSTAGERGPSEGPPAAEAVVEYEDVIKGYELDRDRFVMVSREELEALRPEQSHTIEIEHFVSLADIDPVYFDKSYYLAPQRGVGAEKPYGLLLAAMERTGRIGIARFVLRSKEYLAAIRPVRGLLGLETMFFDDEVRTSEEIDNLVVAADPSSRELDVATRLIELLVTEWDPAQYQDTYRQRVLELIEGKVDARDIHVEEPEHPPATGVPDLMAALKASVEAAKKAAAASKPERPRDSKPRRRRTG
jgi:DNA end-binding protein Ku